MPIYAYRCSACGYQNDYLQKLSDPLLTECPECRKSTFQKQVTAAGFQLKGSGWYVTDFRDNGKAKPGSSNGESKSGGEKASSDSSSSSTDSGSKSAASGSAGASPA
jgi:putative FmdB family regulatory protein